MPPEGLGVKGGVLGVKRPTWRQVFEQRLEEIANGDIIVRKKNGQVVCVIGQEAHYFPEEKSLTPPVV